jgi:predicted enzyme related to lactoylglutathione lyase
MHKSRLAGIVIDCRSDDLDEAAAFWGAALGYEPYTDSRTDTSRYRILKTPEGEVGLDVQKVDHESRVHLDIETDDIEAEVARLENLGAVRVARTPGWVVMQAPTGQRFCVVKVFRANFDAEANRWA